MHASFLCLSICLRICVVWNYFTVACTEPLFPGSTKRQLLFMFYSTTIASTWATTTTIAQWWKTRVLSNGPQSCHVERGLTARLLIPFFSFPLFRPILLTLPRIVAVGPMLHNWFWGRCESLCTSSSYKSILEASSRRTLKDKLWETLKELKTGTSNEEGFEKAVLQPDDVLTRLKGTDSHATRNILKLRQTMVDHSSSGGNPPTLGQVQDGSQGPRSPSRHRLKSSLPRLSS